MVSLSLINFYIYYSLSIVYKSTDQCSSDPCENGQCNSELNNEGWSCDCFNGWVGQRCDVRESKYQSITCNTNPVVLIKFSIEAIGTFCKIF